MLNAVAARQPATIGFRSRTALDESPETAKKVRMAVKLAKGGDRDALHYLYTLYADNVYGYVRSIVHD